MYEPAIFIKTFVSDLDAALSKLKPNAKLTQLQRMWLGFCLMFKNYQGHHTPTENSRYTDNQSIIHSTNLDTLQHPV